MNVVKLILGALMAPRAPQKLRASCGHDTLTEGSVTVNCHTIAVRCTKRPIPFCLACVKKLATLCAGCGKPILPGAPVLRSTIQKEELFGTCCTEMGVADCTGRWTVEGYQEVPFAELLDPSPV